MCACLGGGVCIRVGVVWHIEYTLELRLNCMTSDEVTKKLAMNLR